MWNKPAHVRAMGRRNRSSAGTSPAAHRPMLRRRSDRMQLVAATALGAVWVARLLRTGEGYRLRGKVVLITGDPGDLGLPWPGKWAAAVLGWQSAAAIPSHWSGLALRWPGRERRSSPFPAT